MKVQIKMKSYYILIICSLLMMNITLAQDSTSAMDNKDKIEAVGEFSPEGPPKNPKRVEAGKGCIVDLIESYNFSGSLSGKIVFNYRILIKGPWRLASR